jgi:hypothetical protein
LRVARLEADFAADGGNAETVSVATDTADYTVKDAAVGGKWRVASGE